MKQYERYKESGVEWLGRVPEQWEIVKGKRLFQKMDRLVHRGDKVVTCFRDGQVTLREKRRIEGFTNSLKEIGYQGIKKGDLVIHNMDAFAGAIGVSDSDGKSTPVYSVCTPINSLQTNVFYYAYLLRTLAINGLIISLAKGIRERSTDFRFTDFGNLEYYVPPIKEQNIIVNFLDQKCAQIDKAISQKERVIELLNERRQIIIQRAVTRGLDRNVPMKESGVEWVGKIPEHWKVKRIKNIGMCRNGLTYSPNDICSDREGTLVLRSSNISKSKLILTDNVYVKSKIPNDLLVKKGDILICSRNGSANLVGKLAIIDSSLKATFGAFMMIFRSNYPSNYISYILEVTMKRYMGEFSTSTINQLTLSIFSKMFVPFIDDLNEQQQIATYLDQVNIKIDKAIALKRQEIKKLKEYKTVLIDAAVTGKIKIA